MSCRNQRKTGPRRKKKYELIWPGDLYIIIIFFWFMFVVVVVGFSVFLFFLTNQCDSHFGHPEIRNLKYGFNLATLDSCIAELLRVSKTSEE